MNNVMEKIRKTSEIINPSFDAPVSAIMEIEQNSNSKAESACNGFMLGYYQGLKAAKAEI